MMQAVNQQKDCFVDNNHNNNDESTNNDVGGCHPSSYRDATSFRRLSMKHNNDHFVPLTPEQKRNKLSSVSSSSSSSSPFVWPSFKRGEKRERRTSSSLQSPSKLSFPSSPLSSLSLSSSYFKLQENNKNNTEDVSTMKKEDEDEAKLISPKKNPSVKKNNKREEVIVNLEKFLRGLAGKGRTRRTKVAAKNSNNNNGMDDVDVEDVKKEERKGGNTCIVDTADMGEDLHDKNKGEGEGEEACIVDENDDENDFFVEELVLPRRKVRTSRSGSRSGSGSNGADDDDDDEDTCSSSTMSLTAMSDSLNDSSLQGSLDSSWGNLSWGSFSLTEEMQLNDETETKTTKDEKDGHHSSFVASDIPDMLPGPIKRRRSISPTRCMASPHQDFHASAGTATTATMSSSSLTTIRTTKTSKVVDQARKFNSSNNSSMSSIDSTGCGGKSQSTISSQGSCYSWMGSSTGSLGHTTTAKVAPGRSISSSQPNKANRKHEKTKSKRGLTKSGSSSSISYYSSKSARSISNSYGNNSSSSISSFTSKTGYVPPLPLHITPASAVGSSCNSSTTSTAASTIRRSKSEQVLLRLATPASKKTNKSIDSCQPKEKHPEEHNEKQQQQRHRHRHRHPCRHPVSSNVTVHRRGGSTRNIESILQTRNDKSKALKVLVDLFIQQRQRQQQKHTPKQHQPQQQQQGKRRQPSQASAAVATTNATETSSGTLNETPVIRRRSSSTTTISSLSSASAKPAPATNALPWVAAAATTATTKPPNSPRIGKVVGATKVESRNRKVAAIKKSNSSNSSNSRNSSKKKQNKERKGGDRGPLKQQQQQQRQSHLLSSSQGPEKDSSIATTKSDRVYVKNHRLGRGRGNNDKKKKNTKYPITKEGRYTGYLSVLTGLPCGNGRLEFHSLGGGSGGEGYYDGEWSHGVWSGYGHLKITPPTSSSPSLDHDGTHQYVSYEGEFMEDQKHGQGIVQYSDGRKFHGKFMFDNIIEGTMTYQDGGYYCGPFRNGKRQTVRTGRGRGMYVYADGKSKYVGEFANDIISGHGQLIWEDGTKYVGEWQYGLPNGFGREFHPNGELKREGIWKNGKFVG